MTDDDLASFIHSSLRSVWALELLLLMKRRTEEAWTPDALVRELRASAPLVAEVLQELVAAGLVSGADGGEFRYAPASRLLGELCDELEATYRKRPLWVVRTITSSPKDRLQTFADAFRIRDDKQ